MDTTRHLVHGTGLGLRRPLLSQLVETPPKEVDFYEVAPKTGLPSAAIWQTVSRNDRTF